MAQNKGAIVRYRAIDRCLRSKHGKYGIEELRAACAEALYDAFSERMSVSRRQIYEDLNHMESNAGYRAEIEHYRDGKKMYYRYADPDFSIEKTPISSEEMDQLKETILMLNRSKDTPIAVETVVNDIDTQVVAIVRKFTDTFATLAGQNEVKRQLRSILWIKYKIKDNEVFEKAYKYIEMYY